MSSTKYVDPLLDVSFKRIFWAEPNRDLLISFLNAVFEGKKKIVDLVYNENEFHAKLNEDDSVIFDLLCTGDKDENFWVQVLKSGPAKFREKALFYTSRLICEQEDKEKINDLDDDLEVHFVGIVQENITDDHKYFHDVYFSNRNTGEIAFDWPSYKFIELNKFVKTEEELVSDLDNWLYSLKYLKEMDNLPPHLQKTIFEKLYHIADYTNMTKEEQEIYDQERKRRWDNAAVRAQELLDMEKEKARMLDEGIAKGIVEGRAEVALNLKKMGLSNEQISEGTGLSIEEIEKL